MSQVRAVRGRSRAEYEIVKEPSFGRWITGAVAVVVAAAALASLWNNPNLKRDVIGHYLFSEPVLKGVGLTMQLTAIVLVIGVAMGLALAAMRLSSNRVLVAASWCFTWVFRSVPPIVQLIFWAFLGALYPQIELGIPFTDVVFVSVPANDLIKPFTAAVIGLSLIEAAYSSEVIRAGLTSVDPGQVQAAEALGLSSRQTFRRIVLPQAMPTIIPPMANNAIILMKGTSLVSVIGGAELMTSVQSIYAQTFDVIPMLIVASIWYLGLVSVLSIGQIILERHYSKAFRAQSRARVELPRAGEL